MTLTGRNGDVLRRQEDGAWRFVIDNPGDGLTIGIPMYAAPSSAWTIRGIPGLWIPGLQDSMIPGLRFHD